MHEEENKPIYQRYLEWRFGHPFVDKEEYQDCCLATAYGVLVGGAIVLVFQIALVL